MIRQLLSVLLLASIAHAADDIRFSGSTVVENRGQGQKIVTTHATNDADESRSVYVTSGGIRYNAGTLEPGKSATVTVVEQAGKQPVILFDQR
jgi:hypothetical protein